MDELFLEVFSEVASDGTCMVPVETVIVLFAYKYCRHPPVIEIRLTQTSLLANRCAFKVHLSSVLYSSNEFINEGNDSPANTCVLPVLLTCEKTTCVAGLCGVLRQILKSADPLHPLLGFKQSCLYACAEFSIWTKFCEIDIVAMVNDVFSKSDVTTSYVEIPTDIARFEMHMAQPVRIHNIQKQKQDSARAKGLKIKSSLPDSRLDLLEDLKHTFAEGPEISLADVIIFPCIFLVFQNIGSVFLKQHLPLTYEWFDNIQHINIVEGCLKIISNVEKRFGNEIYVNYIFPNVPKQSLYKSDPKRYKSQTGIFTKQEEIDGCLEKVKQMMIPVGCEEHTFGQETPFEWSSVPFYATPEGGQLPPQRLKNKSQQLENLVKAIVKIARAGDVIVDFCSGSGHLGLILSHSLPRCKVIFLENKRQSLERARDRAVKLKLSNVLFCQTNIDYFRGDFDIGVALHACGVATDLVLERCLEKNAAFVCCPCCYGAIQPNHMVKYPRSQVFRSSSLSPRDYLVIGHSSDQTHDSKNVKTNQGNTCMAIIDTDRILRAREAGYTVVLSKLNPPTCTPKNNLLVGVPKDWKLPS